MTRLININVHKTPRWHVYANTRTADQAFTMLRAVALGNMPLRLAVKVMRHLHGREHAKAALRWTVLYQPAIYDRLAQ